GLGGFFMRWYIIRTLFHKEVLRHLADRGGVALALLLIVAALLLSFFGHDGADPTSFAGRGQGCYVDSAAAGPGIEHLRQSRPAALKRQVKFRPWSEVATVGEQIVYPPGTGAIQVRLAGAARGEPQYRISFWHPGKDGGALAPFEAWFWRETH